jgi:hypothetical protein
LHNEDRAKLAGLNPVLRDWAIKQPWPTLRPIQVKVFDHFGEQPQADLLDALPGAPGCTPRKGRTPLPAGE